MDLSLMKKYVDGFIIPLPKKNRAAYLAMEKLAGKVWIDHGALEYVECIADNAPKGKVTSFPQSVKLKAGETVIFSYIVYKSKTHRERVNKKVMNDPRLAAMMNPDAMPFDGMRMIYGGFSSIVSL